MAIIHTKLTPEDFKKAEDFLKRIKPLLATNEVTIERRDKNRDFDRQYNMRFDEKIKVLKSLTAADCTKIELNNNPRYPKVDVFFFLKDTELFVYGEEEKVTLYIKMYMDVGDQYDQTIVISFHQDGVIDE